MPEHTPLTAHDIVVNLLIFLLASFLGLELIRHVSRLLHTPLMSLTNAISSVSVVAALIVLADPKNNFIMWLAVIAVALAMSNVISGFMITERILLMFKRRGGGERE
ncbi:MAG: NAD(P) transhydrogenase subunit alpha [Verrucomicrobiae bacterium]|nr:NAD(P) transhydrogenase subunit alpha [Armatimonadota bacterium]MCS7339007.1 NAD(P) transhydrogenase subunit alpha [Verrucomicrobiae bacterium]